MAAVASVVGSVGGSGLAVTNTVALVDAATVKVAAAEEAAVETTAEDADASSVVPVTEALGEGVVVVVAEAGSDCGGNNRCSKCFHATCPGC